LEFAEETPRDLGTAFLEKKLVTGIADSTQGATTFRAAHK